MTDLTLSTTEDLIAELRKRFAAQHGAFVYAHCDQEVNGTAKMGWSGSIYTAFGLAHALSGLFDRTFEEDHDSFNVEGDEE